ncbi:RING-type domain-containing protein [Mycena kentingensis (nom. inval.)]|nr:RING-type domain-containing protein [Mycena kentingensis (nom. inval.)]
MPPSTTTHPPQLSLSLTNSSFKRSLQQHIFADDDSLDSPDDEDNRRKRPRSNSSLSEPEPGSSSSSSSSFQSPSTAPRSHLLLDLGDGLESSVAMAMGHEPPPRLPTPELLDSDDVDMLEVSPPNEPSSPAEHVRRSVERFNAFDRHMNVLRSSSPPVIPLPAELSARHSPPTLPPLPLVDLALHPDPDGEPPAESTAPRLDLNLPETSLSPPAPVVATHEAPQFRQRLDSAIDGLGTGDLDFQVPDSDASLEPGLPSSISRSSSTGTTRSRPTVTTPLFDWSSSPPLQADTSRPDTSSAPPSLSPWRPLAYVRPSQVTAATNRTNADIQRFIGGHRARPSSPPRLYPRPASLAAPLSVQTTSSAETNLEADLVGPFLHFSRSTEAMENALDRPRSVQNGRLQEARERLEREHDFEREDESERERDHPWRIDSLWTDASGEERDWSQFIRARRAAEAYDETDQLRRRTLPTAGRSRRRDDEVPSSSLARAIQFLENHRDVPGPRLPSPHSLDRHSDPEHDEFVSRLRPLHRTSISNWIGERSEQPEAPTIWNRTHSEVADAMDTHPTARSRAETRTWRQISAHNRDHAGDDIRSRMWQPPRLALSPPSTAQPSRTAAHARAQSIPNASGSFPSSSVHRLRSRLSGPLRAAAVGSSNSLVAESVVARRRDEARQAMLDRISRENLRMGNDSDSDEDWELYVNDVVRRNASSAMEDDNDAHLASRSQRRLPRLPEPLSLGPIQPLRIHPHPRNDVADAPEEDSFNTRQARFRRPIPHLRQHSTGETSLASSSVDRRHVSWEAPSSRDSSTYNYLSALSGLDSYPTTPSTYSRAPTLAPYFGDDTAPFSSLFAPRDRALSRRQSVDSRMSDEEPVAPSLPHPDFGGDFERTEDILRSATDDLDSSTASRPPSPPIPTTYTGPFRLTMQRRDEYSRRAARRIPDPPSIPPLRFAEPDQDGPPLSSRTDTRHRLLGDRSRRDDGHLWLMSPTQSDISTSNQMRENERDRRLYHYAGPFAAGSSPPRSRTLARRPLSSRSAAPPLVNRDAPRYSAADMHNVLARRVRLEGSRLDIDDGETASHPLDLHPNGGTETAHSRAQQLISQYREQLGATESGAGTSTPMSRRADREVLELRRRRLGLRSLMDQEGRMRASRDVHGMPFQMFGAFGRRALGDFVRDEDLDMSYEGLLSLSGIIGDARPKGASEEMIAGLDSASFGEWATEDSDQRCPICLDDYRRSDVVMRLGECRHWLHKECLVQWLQGGNKGHVPRVTYNKTMLPIYILALSQLVAAQFFDFNFGGQRQHAQERPSWSSHLESVSCSQYLCPGTLDCVSSPRNCPCPQSEDIKCLIREPNGEATVICARGESECREVERLARALK